MAFKFIAILSGQYANNGSSNNSELLKVTGAKIEDRAGITMVSVIWTFPSCVSKNL